MTQTDIRARWDEEIAVYRDRVTDGDAFDSHSDAAERLRRFAWLYLFAWPKGFTDSIAVFLGLMHGIAVKDPRPGLPSLGLWILSLLLRPANPAWNDYWMVRWIVTHDHFPLEEIHRRARHLWRVDVTESAMWIVRSYRLLDENFAAAIAEVESGCELCREPEGADKIGPVDGERVVLCKHFDATPEYLRMIGGKLHFYFVGDGILRRSDGAQLRPRWLVLCGVCQLEALRVSRWGSPLSLRELCREYAHQDSDWVGAPPTGTR